MLAEAKREAERVVKEARDQQERLISDEEVYRRPSAPPRRSSRTRARPSARSASAPRTTRTRSSPRSRSTSRSSSPPCSAVATGSPAATTSRSKSASAGCARLGSASLSTGRCERERAVVLRARSWPRCRGRRWSARSRRSRPATPSEAKRLCEAMKWESQFMHDLLVDGVAGLISFVKEQARRRRGRGGVGVLARAQLAQAGRDDRRSRPQGRRRGAGGDLARALDQRRRPEPGRVRDRRGRREADLHDEPVRLGPAAVAQPPLRPRRLGGDRRGARRGATAARASRSTAPTARS